MEGGGNTVTVKGFETWVHISIGNLTVESGFTSPHYAPDVMRDSWLQTIMGLMETLQGATALGLVQVVSEEVEEEYEETEDEDS